MKKLRLPLIYGSIAGAIMSLSWLTMTIFFMKDGKIDFDASEVAGYTVMILSLSAVFLGIKYERDRNRKGFISFKDAFVTGLLIVLVASVFYTVAWAIYYPLFMPDFVTQYTDCQLQKYQQSGFSPEVLAEKTANLQKMMALYDHPFFMLVMTFMEIFPIGLVMTLIFSFILKRKTPVDASQAPTSSEATV